MEKPDDFPDSMAPTPTLGVPEIPPDPAKKNLLYMELACLRVISESRGGTMTLLRQASLTLLVNVP